MKKTITFIFVVSILVSACSGDNTIETSEAKNVKKVETEETTELNQFDKESCVQWRAWHYGGVGERFGKIYLSSVSALINDGELSNLKVVIDMKSLTVDNFSPEEDEKRVKLTGHLQSEDFFDVEKNPIAIFEMTSIEDATGEFNSSITGNLTINGVTKNIIFNANVEVLEDKVSIHSEDFIVNRNDWGLSYHSEGSEGVPLDYIISDDIGFTVNVEIKKN